jgi:hypothetical protein
VRIRPPLRCDNPVVTEDAHRDLLERATVALERQERSYTEMIRRWERHEAEAQERQKLLLERHERHEAEAREQHRLLLERHERHEAEAREQHARLLERHEHHEAEAREHHERLLQRIERGEHIFVAALSEINVSLGRNTQRLDEMGERIRDMGEAIRADTQAVLTVLDRLEPGSA